MDKKEELLDKYQHAIMLHFFAMGKHRGLVGRAGRPVDNPSSGQGRVLACLKLKDGIGIKDLAQILGMSVPSLNDLLMKMEYGGFIERHPVSDGDTISQVFLTDKGKGVNQNDPAAAADHASVDVDPLEGFSDEELEIMEGYLDRMIANLESNVGIEEIEDLHRKHEERKEYLHRQFCGAEEVFAKVANGLSSGLHAGYDLYASVVHDDKKETKNGGDLL